MSSKSKTATLAATTSEPLETMLERPAKLGQETAEPSAGANAPLRLATLVAATTEGWTVEYVADHQTLTRSALSVSPLSENELGRTVVISNLDGDAQVVILGILQETKQPATAPAELEVDRERVEINATEEIVLRCGEASIKLDKTGTVTIKGKTLLSRARGINRVQGGGVQIN